MWDAVSVPGSPHLSIASLDDQLGPSCTCSWQSAAVPVGLIQFKLVAATQTISALSIAIPIVIPAFLRPGQAHREGWIEQDIGIAVVCVELVHEVRSGRWPPLRCETWKIR